jgi:hypothetical protein
MGWMARKRYRADLEICRLAVVSQVTIGWNELLGILQRLGSIPGLRI